MRLTFLTRSAVRDRRSRLICRRSSCSAVGAFAMAQTRGSPRLWASKALTKASPSTPSVLTRRRRRDVTMEAGSTTWLSMFAFCKSPMNPEPVQASLMDHNQTVRPPCSRLALCLQLGKPRKKGRDIAATHVVPGHLFPAARRQRRDEPRRQAEFQRHENSA